MQKDFWQKNDGQKNEGGMDVSWGGRKMWGRKTSVAWMYRVKAQSGLLWHRISATHVSAFLRIFLRCGWGIVGRVWQKNDRQKDEECGCTV